MRQAHAVGGLGLAAIKADGTYDQIYTKYFGAPPAKMADAPASAASK
ncbi:MAG: hypothetical protein Q8M96_01610 [Rubrivivax sp.]|nr:hypothetical protein [Rubrivivax sp.]